MKLDIRTYLIMLVLSATCTRLNTSIGVEIGLVLALTLIQIISGNGVFMPRLLALYFALVFIQFAIFPILPDIAVMLLSVLVVNIRSFFPVIICIALIYKTTRVSQIMATMAKMKVPKGVTISLAIAIRYIPTLTEEWKHIREAMWMRSVTSGFNNPLIKLGKKLECYLVPLFVSAIKTSDELSAAAMTRGIDNPNPPTCRNYRPMNGMDYFMIFMSVGITIFCAVLRYV